MKAIESMSPSKEAEKIESSPQIATQKEAAAYCGVSERTIRQWEKEGPLRDAAGNFIKERLDERIADRETEGNPLKTRQMTATAELTEAKAALAKMQMQVRQGELLAKEQVDEDRLKRVVETRRVLLSLPRKLPPVLKGRTLAEMQTAIRDEIHHTLEVFAGKTEPTNVFEDVVFLVSSLTAKEKKQLRAMLLERAKP